MLLSFGTHSYDFADHRELIDIGGASGGWCIGVRLRFPHLRCAVSLHQALMVNGEADKCGWQPSYGEMETLLREAGFAQTRRAPHLIVATKA